MFHQRFESKRVKRIYSRLVAVVGRRKTAPIPPAIAERVADIPLSTSKPRLDGKTRILKSPSPGPIADAGYIYTGICRTPSKEHFTETIFFSNRFIMLEEMEEINCPLSHCQRRHSLPLPPVTFLPCFLPYRSRGTNCGVAPSSLDDWPR